MDGLPTRIQLHKKQQKDCKNAIWLHFSSSSSCLSPACHELMSFVSFVLQAVVAVGSAKTGSGQAEIFAGPAALAGEQAVSLVRVAAAVGPTKCHQKGNIKEHIMAKWREGEKA